MKHRSAQLSTFSTFSRGASRRGFLSKVILAAAPFAATPAPARPSNPEPERLSRLLAKYGSELADLRRVEGKE